MACIVYDDGKQKEGLSLTREDDDDEIDATRYEKAREPRLSLLWPPRH